MNNKFIFYFPVNEIGGIHTLINRFIKEANRVGNNECIVIDNDNGTVFQYLDKGGLKYIKVINDGYHWTMIKEKYNVFEYTLVFMSGGDFYDILSDLKRDIPKLKILFYLVHPETFLNFYVGTMINKLSFNNYSFKKFYINSIYRTLTKLIVAEIDNMSRKNAILFMDEENLQYSENIFNYKFDNVRLLPIPINNINDNIWNRNDRNYFTWLGRLDKSKCNVLQRILIDYKQFVNLNRNIESKFIIIGDGDGRSIIEELINTLQLEKYVELKGNIFKEDLEKEILNSSILFAMGTSALEGARMGVPTVLVDWYKYVPDKVNYRWLYDTKNYTLGKVIEKGRDNYIHSNFNSIVMDFNLNSDYISEKSYLYSKKHEITNVYIKLCEYSQKNNFIIGDINIKELYEKYNNILPVKIWKKKNLK